MKTNLDAVLAYRPDVLNALEAFLKQRQQSPGQGLVWTADVAKRLLDFAGAGKLLRGSLVCYSYRLCRGTKPLPEKVLQTAVALELTHAAMLVHDDIIDQDDLRRGQPALHYQYRRLVARQVPTQAGHFGESMALCAGDMALFMAFELLAAAQSATSSTGGRLGSLFARALSTVCDGQMQDIRLGMSVAQPAKQAIYALMRAKTAAYSIALPLAAGAILAEQPAALQQQLYNLGLATGVIFQIRDDELGVFGQADKLGKPVGNDIRSGKKTLLYYYLWRASSARERQRLGMIFGNQSASQAEIEAVQQALRRHKVPLRIQQDINGLEQTARRQIDKLKVSQTAKYELRELVAFCATRES